MRITRDRRSAGIIVAFSITGQEIPTPLKQTLASMGKAD